MKNIWYVIFLLIIILFPLPSLAEEDVLFSFAVISDTHDINKCHIRQGKWSKYAVEIINDRKPAFVVGAGDLIGGGGECKHTHPFHTAEEQWAEFKKVYLDKLKVPFVPVAGNHDGFGIGKDNGMIFWEKFWDNNKSSVLSQAKNASGFPESSYRFTYKGVYFSMISYYKSWGLQNEEMSWIENNVQSGDLVFKHIHPYNVNTESALALNDSGDIKNYPLFVKKLEEKNISTLFSGHNHAFYDATCNNFRYVNTGTLGKRVVLPIKGMVNYWNSKKIGQKDKATQSFVWVDVLKSGLLSVSFYYFDGTEMVLFDKDNFPGEVKAHIGKYNGHVSGVESTCETIKDDVLIPEHGSGVIGEIEQITHRPQPKINIPGLNFSPENLVLHADEHGNEFLSIPYLGEYLAAIYRYGVAIMSIIAVVMIINSGFTLIISGGNSEKVTEAKKMLLNSITGLLLAVGSYTILYLVNPELVKFKNLRVITFTPQSLDYALEGEHIHPEDELNPSTAKRLCSSEKECLPICKNKEKWGEYKLAGIPDESEVILLSDAVKKHNMVGIVARSSATTGKPARILPSIVGPLKKAGKLASSQGLEINVYYGFRSLEEQLEIACDKIIKGTFNPSSIAWPGGSRHGSGTAIDVQLKGTTIINGKKETGISAPTKRAVQNNKEYRKFNKKLAEIMYAAGWKRLKSEVWHFEYPKNPLEDSRTVSCFETSC